MSDRIPEKFIHSPTDASLHLALIHALVVFFRAMAIRVIPARLSPSGAPRFHRFHPSEGECSCALLLPSHYRLSIYHEIYPS